MTDFDDDFDLDDLKSALNNATPAPDAKAKADNIALATKNFADLQGSRNAARPTSSNNIWTGAKTMLNTLTSRAGMTVTTAIVACGFMIGTPTGRDILNLDPTTAKIAPAQTSEIAVDPIGSVSVQATQADEIAAATDDVQSRVRTEATPTPQQLSEPVMEMAPAITTQDDINQNLWQRRPKEQAPVAPAPQMLTRVAPSDGAVASIASDTAVVQPTQNTETFANDAPNPLKITSEEPVSTFSIDVDTAAYSLVRSSLTRGQLPLGMPSASKN